MERNLRKTRVGVVVSDKMDKTIVVAVKDINICTSNAGLHKNPVTHSIRIASATVIILSQPICCLWHSILYQKIARKMLQAKS